MQDKVIVITGASRGFGRATARKLSHMGARVIITGRDPEALQLAKEQLDNKVATSCFDVTDSASVTAAFDKIIHDYGAIDVLVNNAGVLGPVNKFWETSVNDWCESFDINLKGTVLCTHCVLKHMHQNKRGIIINVVSNAGVYRWPTCSTYSTSKAAIIKFTENLAVEALRSRVYLFSYHPGLIHDEGMSVAEVTPPPEPGSIREKAFQWFLDEHKAGRTVSVEQGTHNLAEIIRGSCNKLSGRYLTVFDELDKLQATQSKSHDVDFRMLRVHD